MNKISTNDWKARGELIRASMANEQPPVRIERVMEVLKCGKGTAHYALVKLQELGIVKWIAGKWYLV